MCLAACPCLQTAYWASTWSASASTGAGSRTWSARCSRPVRAALTTPAVALCRHHCLPGQHPLPSVPRNPCALLPLLPPLLRVAAGYGIGRQPSLVQRAVERINPKALLSKGFGSKALSGPASNGSARIPAGPTASAGGGGSSSLASDPSPPGSSGRGAAAAAADDGAEAPQAVPLSAPAAAAGPGHAAPTKLPQSPFDVPSSGGSSSSTVRSLAPPGKSNMMMYQHSMLRLRSSVADGRGGKLDLATLEEGRAAGEAETDVRGASTAERGALAAVAAAAEPEVTLEAPQGASGASSSCQGISSSRVPSAVQELPGGSWQNTAIRVATRCGRVCAVSCYVAGHLLAPALLLLLPHLSAP